MQQEKHEIGQVKDRPASQRIKPIGLAVLTLALTVHPATPGFAAISFRSSHSAVNAVSTTLVIDTPAGVVAGDVLLAVVSVRGAPTIAKPGGWTPVRTNASGTAIKQAIYRRVATAAEPASYIWTFGAAKAASGGIVAYAGVDAVSPVVASSGGANASSMSITAPSVDTGVDDTVVVGFFGVRIAGTIAPPIDMAERFDVAGSGAAATVSAADVVQPAAGPTGIKVATASSAGVGIGQLVALRPAGGSPSGNAPTAIARRASTFEGRPVSIELSARDEEQCELTFSIASAPSSGSVGPITNYVCKQGTPNSDKGSVTYVPTGGFVGTDTFTYRASDGSSESNAATVTIEVKLPPVSVVPVDETPPVAGSGDVADDPAIWVHPTDPSLSLVIGTSKHLTAGGLYVYDLDGMELQYLATGSPNNVDLRYGFTLNGQSIDLVAAANKATNAIDLYKVNVATRLLESVGSVSSSVPAMAGFCMYHSPTGKFYAIGNHSNGVMEQFELDGSGPTVTGTVIRSFDVGSATEGCAADDELGHLYISEEIQALWKYGAEPDDGSGRVKVEPVGGGSHIVSDAEGIAIYYRSGGAGYLIVSSQGDSSYAVFDREGTNAYVGSFETADGISVDRTTETDGLEVTNVALGSLFPQGLLVLHDHANAGGSTSNFKFVRWDDVAAGLELTIDTNHDPRG